LKKKKRRRFSKMSILTILVLAVASAVVAVGIEILIRKIKEIKEKNQIIVDFRSLKRDRYYPLIKKYQERLEKLGVDFTSDPVSSLFALMNFVKSAVIDYVKNKDKPEVSLEDYIDINLIGQFIIWLVFSKVQVKKDSEENKVITEYFYNLARKIITDKNPEKVSDFEEIVNKINEIVKFK
jgi:predicted PurR-regulated permease PerM